ncbi:IS630 family transposase [Methylorubrum aminovorans]
MDRGPKPADLQLSADERTNVEELVRRRDVGQALAQRARIVLAYAEPGSTNSGITRALGVSRMSVTTWRARFLAHRLDGLVDLPRSGAPRQVGDAEIERVISLTLESQPANATHWSTRAMAQRAGMSQTMVSRVWRAFGLQPHQDETFKLSTDPAFVDKVRDVVGLYLAPPHRTVVLCVDEKPQIQATTRTAPGAAAAARPARATHPRRSPGRHHRSVRGTGRAGRWRHRSVEFRAFLDQVEASVPADLDMHLVLDNAATHKTRLIHEWLLKRPRWHLHFTPTSASWLNLVEGWFALLARRQL